jgi:CHAT domain-containing protein/Tfp pilus assembly protein PilF
VREGDLARASALIESAVGANTDPRGWPDDLRLLAGEISLMRRDLPGAKRLLDAPLATGDQRPRLDARLQYLLGYEQIARQQFDEAMATLEAASAAAARAGASDAEFDAEALLGRALYITGRPEAADARLSAALERARRTETVTDDATLLVTSGMGRLTRDRFDEALGFFEQALAFSSLSRDMVYATALSNAGVCYAKLGEFSKAVDLQTRAIAAHEARQIPLYVEQSQGGLGNTYTLMNEPAKALPFLERAHALASSAGRWRDAALWLDNLTVAHMDLGRWDRAETLNDESAALKVRQGDSTVAYNALARARIAAGRGELSLAVERYEAVIAMAARAPHVEWQAHGFLAETLIAQGDRRRAMAEFDRALALIDEARADLAREEYQFAFLARLIDFHRSYVDALVDLGDSARALEIADFSRARVLAERTDGASVTRTRASLFVQRARQHGATLVAYWLGPKRSHAWIVTGRGIDRVELPAAPTIDALVERHRQFIERSVADPMRAPNTPSDALAAAVLEPIRALIPNGSRVILVPDGSLHGVNFESLPVGAPKHYWIEDATIALAPSLSVATTRPTVTSRRSNTILVMGDASGGGQPPLAYAGREIDTVVARLGSERATVHRGAAARPEVFLDSASATFGLIHFAAHATSNAASPLDSTIELSPGTSGRAKLYARDIARLRLSADLVTVSACRGVGDRAYSGEGPVGLAWAFMRAGAARVVAGLWDVDDASTAGLMGALYEGLAKGEDPATALRAAKLDLIRRGGATAKPFYWAPLQLFTTRL